MFYLMSAVVLIGVKIWLGHLKALEIRMRKLVLDLSVAQILPEKINKMFLTKKLGFIDVLRAVFRFFKHFRLNYSYSFFRFRSNYSFLVFQYRADQITHTFFKYFYLIVIIILFQNLYFIHWLNEFFKVLLKSYFVQAITLKYLKSCFTSTNFYSRSAINYENLSAWLHSERRSIELSYDAKKWNQNKD